MTNREKKELRRQWAYDIKNTIDKSKYPDIFERANALVQQAEIDVLELSDPAGAETRRRLIQGEF